jgi:hypothetical protein
VKGNYLGADALDVESVRRNRFDREMGEADIHPDCIDCWGNLIRVPPLQLGRCVNEIGAVAINGEPANLAVRAEEDVDRKLHTKNEKLWAGSAHGTLRWIRAQENIVAPRSGVIAL